MPNPPKRKNAKGAGRPKKGIPTKTISFRVREEYRDELHAKFSPLIKAEELKLINSNKKNKEK